MPKSQGQEMNADLITAYRAHMDEIGHTEATINGYVDNLNRADRDLPYGLDVSNELEIKNWIYVAGRKQNSKRSYYYALAGFYSWAYRTGYLTLNPMAEMTPPRQERGHPRVARDAQVEWLLNDAKEPYRLWSKLAAYESCRCIEISRMDRDHVRPDTTQLLGKGGKPRLVATHPIVWDAVQELPPGPITHYDRREISSRFIGYCHTQGIRGLSLHRIRGWHATQSHRATRNLLAVQRNMGHADPATTARYIELLDDEVSEAVLRLPQFGRGAGAAGAAGGQLAATE